MFGRCPLLVLRAGAFHIPEKVYIVSTKQLSWIVGLFALLFLIAGMAHRAPLWMGR